MYLFEELETLFTKQSHSPIQRSRRFGVGKWIGGKIYAHRNYMKNIFSDFEVMKQLYIVDIDIFLNSINTVAKDNNFSYNCFCFDMKNNQLILSEAPDFNTASEPVVGNILKIDLLTMEVLSKRYVQQIWHHKWLWVKDDYEGFDVKKSYNWSKKWLSVLTEPANGSNEHNWMKQLDKFNLLVYYKELNES